MTPEKALNIAAGICSQKEYCTQEIREKLQKWDLSENEITHILASLRQHRFIDDRRFATFYARDKFRFNKWGRQKIAQMLRQKKIEPAIIQEALAQLPPEDYDTTCLSLLQGKLKTLKNDTPLRIKAKLIRFAAGRGFDLDTINRCLSRLSLNVPDEQWDE